MIDKFNTAYNEVFDEQNEIKVCGRERCMKLINIADHIEKGIDHGNIETGFMNVKNIQDLHKRLNDSNFV